MISRCGVRGSSTEPFQHSVPVNFGRSDKTLLSIVDDALSEAYVEDAKLAGTRCKLHEITGGRKANRNRRANWKERGIANVSNSPGG